MSFLIHGLTILKYCMQRNLVNILRGDGDVVRRHDFSRQIYDSAVLIWMNYSLEALQRKVAHIPSSF